MAGPAVEQRLAAILAAILAADVVGYLRLMQDDEHAILADLDACRAVFCERIAAAGGRVVDTAGGSVLAVFGPADLGGAGGAGNLARHRDSPRSLFPQCPFATDGAQGRDRFDAIRARLVPRPPG